MSETIQFRKTPWHLWLVGVVGVLWNAYGGYDFVMSMTKGEVYFRELGIPDAQIAYYLALPAWMTIVWAIGVWGAILGSVLLLLRSKWAFEVFVASLLAFVMSLVYENVIAPAPALSQEMMIFQGIILVGCVFFVWYARFMRKAGHLR